METTFTRLNPDWNADPVDPQVSIAVHGSVLRFEFTLNNLMYPRFAESQRALLVFDNCSRYRLGATNDEGWYLGQCRFSGVVRRWGEFYEINGDSRFEESPNDWIPVATGSGANHYLFYMKEETFECLASGYQFTENAG